MSVVKIYIHGVLEIKKIVPSFQIFNPTSGSRDTSGNTSANGRARLQVARTTACVRIKLRVLLTRKLCVLEKFSRGKVYSFFSGAYDGTIFFFTYFSTLLISTRFRRRLCLFSRVQGQLSLYLHYTITIICLFFFCCFFYFFFVILTFIMFPQYTVAFSSTYFSEKSCAFRHLLYDSRTNKKNTITPFSNIKKPGPSHAIPAVSSRQ